LLAATEQLAQTQSTSKVKFLDYDWSLNPSS